MSPQNFAKQQQSSPSASSQQSQPSTTSTPTSQQQWESRVNDMDTAYQEAATSMTQVLSQLVTAKTGVSNGQIITWSQLEQISQQLQVAFTQVQIARQRLPIGVTT